MSFNEMEDGVVGRIPVWFLAQYEVVEAGVNGAYRDGIGAHLLDSHSYVLDHEWVEHSIAILETWIIVASVDLSA